MVGTAGRSDTIASQDFRSTLMSELERHQERTRWGAKRWNSTYYFSLFGSILFAALAALLPKIEILGDGFLKRDLPSILAAMAALLTTVMHAGSFERRWRASRELRVRVQALRMELLDPDSDAKKILRRLQWVISDYHRQVLAGGERNRDEAEVAGTSS